MLFGWSVGIKDLSQLTTIIMPITSFPGWRVRSCDSIPVDSNRPDFYRATRVVEVSHCPLLVIHLGHRRFAPEEFLMVAETTQAELLLAQENGSLWRRLLLLFAVGVKGLITRGSESQKRVRRHTQMNLS
jgi:hypothetical protein